MHYFGGKSLLVALLNHAFVCGPGARVVRRKGGKGGGRERAGGRGHRDRLLLLIRQGAGVGGERSR